MNTAIPHPPAITDTALTYSRRLRFNVLSSSSNVTSFDADITYGNLSTLCVLAVTGTNANALFSEVRVRAVEVWTPAIGFIAPLSVNNPRSCSVRFNDNGFGLPGDGKLHMDTAMGVEPGHVLARPVKQSYPDLWNGFDAAYVGATCFHLVAPMGSVVDVILEFRRAYGVATGFKAVTGATAGKTYFIGLDGNTLSTSLLPPADVTASI
jgi:hypothetical protein